MTNRDILEANLHARQPTNNPWVATQRRMHNLPTDASLFELSQVARPLLEEGPKVLEGCELILGCRIEATERRKAVLLMFDQRIEIDDKVEILQREAIGINIGPY